MTDLDEYEQDILQSVENGEWESKKNIDERLLELQSYVKHQKKKGECKLFCVSGSVNYSVSAISIRVSENDIYELKKKALENGVPYQNLIQILIHQFTTNKIHLNM